MKIAVTGGKGGIGKTLISVFLARKLSKKRKVLLVDADVENPNINTFFGYKLRKIGDVYKKYPKIDIKKCEKCGVCAKKCRINAIAWTSQKYPIIIEDICKGCMLCKYVCPFGAIREKKRKIGELRVGGRNPKVLEGKVLSGIRESSLVIEKLMNASEKVSVDIKIYDTSAGIHCNVVGVLREVDNIILVVEPTPFGIEDFKRILKVVLGLRKPFYAIINKADIGNKSKIYNLSKEFGFEIIGEIEYNEKIAKYCSIGKIPELGLGDILEHLSS